MATTPKSIEIQVDVKNLEQIQAFIIEAMDQAWEEGKQAVLEVARDFIDPDSMEYFDELESPYRKK